MYLKLIQEKYEKGCTKYFYLKGKFVTQFFYKYKICNTLIEL